MGLPSPPNTGVLLKRRISYVFEGCCIEFNVNYLLMGLGKVLPKSWSTNWAKKTKFTLVKSSGTLLLFKRWPKAKEIRLLMTLGLGKGWPVARLTRNWLTPSKNRTHRKIDFLFNTFQKTWVICWLKSCQWQSHQSPMLSTRSQIITGSWMKSDISGITKGLVQASRIVLQKISNHRVLPATISVLFSAE